jgi:hypothetical protein
MSSQTHSNEQVDSAYVLACLERERSIKEDALPYQFDYANDETEEFKDFAETPIHDRVAMLKKAIIRVDNLFMPSSALEEHTLDSVNDEIKDLHLQEEQLEARFWRLYAIVAFMQRSYERQNAI